MMLRRTLAAAALLGFAWMAQAEVAVPALHARVTDLTGTLDGGQTAALELKLSAFEQAKGSQIAVLIVPTTQPEEIEQYGIRVAEQWKLGRKGVDDGAILIVAKDDHRLRIEVGYGLEGVLNDAIAKRIVSDTITPRFRSGDYAGGIDAGVQQMIGVVDGEPLPPPSRRQVRAGGDRDASGGIGVLLIPFLIACFVGRLLKSLLGTAPAALAVGGVTGFAAFLLLSSIGVAVVAGLIAAVVAAVIFLGGGRGGFGGFIAGGGFGGGLGGGGGGGGGGGFSGGGGSFGGGGSSGSW